MTIVGWGTALPDKTVTNEDLEARIDTSDTWIRERTGIRERRIGHSTTSLAIEAGRQALENAGVDGADIDLVIICTSTPDETMPASAAVVQDALGVFGGGFDLNAACAGYVYGLVTANGLLAAGVERILLVGAETMSRIVNWDDRNTAVLFGDGAGALVLERSADHGQLLSWDLATDGSTHHLLHADLGGYMEMDGKGVYRAAVRMVVESARTALAAAEVEPADISLFVPHQANIRIIDAVCHRLAIPRDRATTVLETTGNTSSASVALALVAAIEEARLQDDDLILFSGFGAGMTCASAVVRWADPRS